MKELLKDKNIDTLYHFTQANNLLNIFQHGLLPRKDLEEQNIDSYFNDEYRYDKCKNAICTSIAFPNYKMFYSLRQEDPTIDWAVLKLDTQILCDFDCAYCWTNAGDASIYNTPIEQRMGENAFLGLFEDRNGYPKRKDLNIPKSYPTNPQAEVLVFGNVPVEYIQAVYFQDTKILHKYKNTIPNDIKCEANSCVFSYREDWSHWKNQED